MRARIATLLVAFAATLLGPGHGDTAVAGGSGAKAVAAGGAKRSTYLGPRDGGTGWIRSRPKRVSVIWAVGDGGIATLRANALAGMIASQRVDRLLYLGDVYEHGTALEYEINYRPTFGRFDSIAAPTIGNHEWDAAALGYIPYWTRAKGTPPPLWYAFAASGWQLISLNTNAPVAQSPQQLGWLNATISHAPRYGNCRIAFFHHPIYSAGAHGDTPGLDPIVSLLEGDSTIALSGHDHDMQRMNPINGITQLVDGAGGRSVYPVNRSDPRLAFADDTYDGAIRLKLTPGRAAVSFVASDGAVLDQSVVHCAQAGTASVAHSQRRTSRQASRTSS